MRNYNADQAGLILHTYYMKINERGEMETPMWIETINYIDSNGNGVSARDKLRNLILVHIDQVIQKFAAVLRRRVLWRYVWI